MFSGFSPDPVLSGQAVAQTIKGIQSAGVVACTKHFIGNEQEHYRNPGQYDQYYVDQSMSANIDDKTMHELYLWFVVFFPSLLTVADQNQGHSPMLSVLVLVPSCVLTIRSTTATVVLTATL